jgi:hypothetical protein
LAVAVESETVVSGVVVANTESTRALTQPIGWAR